MNKLNFVFFFDEGINDQFDMMYDSLKKVYGENYRLFIGTTNNNKHLIDKYSKDEFINMKFIDDDIKIFSKNGLFGSITNFTFARFLIKKIFGSDLKDEKFIYADVDILFRKKIDEKYFDSNENFASTNIEDSNLMLPIKFWDNHLKSRGNKFEIEEKFIAFSKGLKRKMLNKQYFNAGVIIVNNPKVFYSLLDIILEDQFDLLDKLDDQTLLNLYNTNEITTLSDSHFNFKVTKDSEIDNQSIFHFLGPTKNIMTRVYNSNYDFDILKNLKTNFRTTTLIFEIGEVCDKKCIEKAKQIYFKYKDQIDILFMISKQNVKTNWIKKDCKKNIINFGKEEFLEQKSFILSKVKTDFVWVINLNDKKTIDLEKFKFIRLTTKTNDIINIKSAASGKEYLKYINPDTLLIPKWIYESEFAKDSLGIGDMVKKYTLSGRRFFISPNSKSVTNIVGEKNE